MHRKRSHHDNDASQERHSKKPKYEITPPSQYLLCNNEKVYSKDRIRAKFATFKEQFTQNLYKHLFVEDADNKYKIDKYKGKHELKINHNAICLMLDEQLEDRHAKIISDFFVEDVRIHASRVKYLSPYDYFEKHRKEWEPEFVRRMSKSKKKDDYERYLVFRELMLDGTNPKEHPKLMRDCPTFPYSVGLALFHIFKPRRILDMCAGWGDRMISAMLWDADAYVGVDPNSQLQPKYKNMIETLLPQEKQQHYKVICSPFEDVKDEDVVGGGELFDMMFSCPPYFVAEKYSDDEGQAHNRYKNGVEDWLNGFMYPSVKKAWGYIRNGGYFTFVLNDTWIEGPEASHYTEQVLDFIEKNCAGAIYEGMLKYVHGRVVQPIWVFRKLVQLSPEVYDCPPVVKQCKIKTKTEPERTLTVFREDYLIGGTKQRIGVPFLQTVKEKHIFYRGPVNGYAQVALAHCCKLLGKQFHIILNKQKEGKYAIACLAMIMGAVVHEVDRLPNNIANRDEKDRERVVQIMKKYEAEGAFEVPLGLKDGSASIELYKKTELAKKVVELNPKKIWLVASTGLIYKFLGTILPECKFGVVFVGDKHYEMIDKSTTEVFEAKQHFREPTNVPPPYSSEISYDAKAWQFIEKNAKDGDFVFNVAGL